MTHDDRKHPDAIDDPRQPRSSGCFFFIVDPFINPQRFNFIIVALEQHNRPKLRHAFTNVAPFNTESYTMTNSGNSAYKPHSLDTLSLAGLHFDHYAILEYILYVLCILISFITIFVFPLLRIFL